MEFFILLIALYFAPTILAYMFRSERTSGIFVLNLFLGWTAIGWIIALVWAFGSDKKRRRPRRRRRDDYDDYDDDY